MLREGQVGFPLPHRDLLIEILAALRSRHGADLCARARISLFHRWLQKHRVPEVLALYFWRIRFT